MLNNSIEFAKSNENRERALQQIITEQKQKIRELEMNLQKPNIAHQYKQQLQECTNQLEESKKIIKQLLLQKEQLTQEIENQKQEQNNIIQKALLELQEQNHIKVQQLEEENKALLEELESYKPLSKALNNYTQEDQYVKQINGLYEFVTLWQKQCMAELVQTKRSLEIQLNSNEQMSFRHQEERKQLQNQLTALIKIDEKIQEDVLMKMEQTIQSLQNFTNEIKNCQITFVGNYEKIELMLLQQIESAKVIFVNKGQQSQIQQQQYSTNQSKIDELNQSQQENNVNEVEYLNGEINLLKQTIEELQDVYTTKEKGYLQEIERYKQKCSHLTETSLQREQNHSDSLQKIAKSVELIEHNYQKRESFFKFNDQSLQNLLDNFRQIVDQISIELKSRKNDYIKDCKELIMKLSKSQNKPKPIKNIERLENICRDLQRNPPLIKQNDEIKSLIIDVTKQILNSQEYKCQTILLFQALDELEGIITAPTKRVDQLLDQFFKELQSLTALREECCQLPNFYKEIVTIIQQEQLQQVTAKQSFDCEQIEQIRKIEKQAYEKEKSFICNKYQRLFETQELKIKQLEFQIRKQDQILNQQYQSNSQQQNEQDILIKSQKQQINKLQKILNETQQQRVNDRKELLKLVQDSEKKQIDGYNQLIKQIENKCNILKDIVTKEVKKFQRIESSIKQDVFEQTDQVDQIKLLQQKDKEKELQYQQRLDQMETILQQLKTNLENLHKEKGDLIEQLDSINKIMQTQKKVFYSFRKQ